MIPSSDSPILAGMLGLPPIVYAVVFGAGILYLFFVDKNRIVRTSNALWIPTVWLFIISSRPISLWLGLAPTIDSPAAYLDGSPVDRIIYIILLISGLWVLAQRSQRVVVLLQRNIPILMFFSYCALSIVWADDPFVAFKRWIKADTELVMILIILTEADPMLTLRRVVTRLGFILFPLSVLFVKYYPALGRLMTKSWEYEATGVSTQKNSLGITCLIYGLTYVWSFRAAYRDRENPERKRRLGIYAVLLATIAWLLKTCDSLTSMCVLLMASSVMLIAGHRRLIRQRPAVQVLAAGVIGLSVFALFFDASGSLVETLGRNATLTGRTEIWKQVLQVPINPLLGAGFESFWLGERLDRIWSLRHQPLNEAHNGYLEVYLNLGWLGIGALAVLLATTYRAVIAKFRQDPEWGSLLVAYFIAAVICSLTEAGFRMMSATWTFLLFARMAATQPSRRISQTTISTPSPPESLSASQSNAGHDGLREHEYEIR